MAVFFNQDFYIEINAVDLSDHVKSVTVNMSQADLDVTAMGDTGVNRIAGLRDDSFDIELYQDFAASEVDATLFSLFEDKTAFTVKVKAVNAAASATNPGYQGTCILTSYPPLSGAVGDVAMSSITLPVSGAITQYTSGT